MRGKFGLPPLLLVVCRLQVLVVGPLTAANREQALSALGKRPHRGDVNASGKKRLSTKAEHRESVCWWRCNKSGYSVEALFDKYEAQEQGGQIPYVYVLFLSLSNTSNR